MFDSKKLIRCETEEGYQMYIPQTFRGYKFIKTIGRGSTSVVALVQDISTHNYFSAKILSKADIIENDLYYSIQKEIAIMSDLDHPNIIKFEESFEITNCIQDKYIVIIMEYCENGDLFHYVTEHGFRSASEKFRILKGFFESIKYLHSRAISHGDIKAENILLDSDLNPKLCDFGFSRTTVIADDDAKNGTLYYAAPELLTSGEFDTLKSDIWSIGIMVYCIFEKTFPYQSTNNKSIMKQIKSGRLTIRAGINSKLKNFVKSCTQLKPEDRPSISELMHHSYFRFNDNSKQNNDNTSSSSDEF